MINNKYKRKTIIVFILVSIIFIVLTSLTVAGSAHDGPPLTDDDQYVTMAYNIQKYRTFSLEYDDIENPEPTAYREPGFPAWLALCISSSPRLSQMSRAELYENGLKQLRLLQIPLIIILGFLTMFLVVKVTKKMFLGYISLFLIGASEILEITANHLFSENLAALFLLGVSILLYLIYKKKKIIYFILLGISLALLVLTKAIFMYFIIIPSVIMLIMIIRGKGLRKKLVSGFFLFLISYSVLFGGWMYRNYRHFDEPFITNGGGIILLYRAGKNSFNSKEYLASFIYWLPGKSVKEALLNRIMEPEDYERLDRSNPASIHETVKRIRAELTEEKIAEGYTRSEADLMAEKEMREMGMKEILAHPFKHIITTIPIAWRGIFIETGYRFEVLNNNLFLLRFESIMFINIFLFFCFFFSIVFLIKRRRWDMFMLFVPSIYLYGIYSFMTQNKPRYDIPILPVLLLSAMLFILFLLQKAKKERIEI